MVAEKHPENLKLLPKVLKMLWRYKRLKVSEEELFCAIAKYGVEFLRRFDDIEKEISLFWDSHEKKIKKWYLEQKTPEDVFLTASPDILVGELARRIGVRHTIASKIDLKGGEVVSLCYRKNKCVRFCEEFPDTEMEEFYTDSENDREVFKMAQRVYIVRGNSLKKIKA